ncbi:MAG: STAS domain-containing protein [Acidimicrobiales bacterium]|nr:STAS domain-containing protein [Acidimicrobiales bacterium]
MLVPQAMAYAELGGLPPAAGFRAVLLALPIYAVLGTSRHLGIGPEPGTAVLAALAVGPLAGGDINRYLTLMAALAGMVGVLAVVGAVLRLGFVAELLSKPVLVGYITGVALTLLSSQLRTFTGVNVTAGDFFPRLGEFFGSIDQTDLPTLAVGIGTLTVILVLRRMAPTLPGALLGLAGSIIAVAVLNLEVAVVGEIDAAVPSFALPTLERSDLRDLLPAAAGLLLIAYTDNILTARSIASNKGYRIDANRELLALGAVNTAAAFGGGFPMSSSASRSVVPASLGSRTQLSSLVSFLSVAIFLLVGRSLLAEIPQAGLAAVVIAAALAIIDVEGFRRLAKVSWSETVLAATTCLAIISTDLLLGVLVALSLSVVMTLHRVARPHDAILGEGEGLDGWIDIADRRATTEPGLLVYRFDAPLFFANAEYFRDRLRQSLERNPGEECHVILDFEGIGSLDSTAADHLAELCRELSNEGMEIAIARANSEVLDVMERSGLFAQLNSPTTYPTINSAVATYRRNRSV